MNEEEIGDRLKLAREHLGMSIAAMAKHVGMSHRGYQDNEAGLRTPKSTVVSKFVELGISSHWLLTGEGEMLLSDSASHDQQQDIVHAVLNEDYGAYERAVERTLPAFQEMVAYAKSLQVRLQPLGEKGARVWAVLFYDLVRDGKVTKEEVEQLLDFINQAFEDGVRVGADRKAAELRQMLGIDQDGE